MSIIDLISTAGRSINRKAFLIGVGSLIDLNGVATYEAMQELMLADLREDQSRYLSYFRIDSVRFVSA